MSDKAVAGDGQGASASGRGTGTGIVVAGDRTISRHIARRHSQTVRILKLALPVSALAAAGLFAGSVVKTAGWGSSIPDIAIPQILPENLAMENPHYEGFNADGGRYWVKAGRAIQDLQSIGTIRLEGISGELTDGQKIKTQLSAERGTFNNKLNLLELFDKIEIAGDNGLKAVLTRASVQTKDGIITSDQPVSVAMQAGTITANQMTIRQKVKEYTFVDTVRATLTPEAKPATDEKSKAKVFGASDKPIVITASRLDINDVAKTAIFNGQVVAEQDGTTLTAPELEVTYQGSAAAAVTPPPTAKTAATAAIAKPAIDAASTDNAGRLKRIFAQSPIELRQASGETVSGRTVEFDAVSKRAIVDGDVVVVQLPDRRAIGDRAEFDSVADTVLLTGAVTLTQGGNEMRGGRLAFNRSVGKMQLTAPTAAGGAGRIFVKFKQETASKTAAKAQPADGDQGVSFGATFKTTPGAPINIEAARLDVDDTLKDAVFTGDVRAIQGDFIIRAATLTAKYTGAAGLGAGNDTKAAAAQLTRIKARDKVQVTGNDGQTATGDWAEFDPKANMATLGGNVILTQGKNVVRGTKLVIDMTTGESTIKTESAASTAITAGGGASDGTTVTDGRPSAVFYPSDMKNRATKAAKSAIGGAAAGRAGERATGSGGAGGGTGGTTGSAADGSAWQARSQP
ncbi:MAG: LPS export ABC transporter periplasmic protein LptC [Hyphomicrobium sp.]|nr:LPS export ABC transporter periplasmic protein LptC [Hyphomicrobium sp.]